jgi:hypothetical protein
MESRIERGSEGKSDDRDGGLRKGNLERNKNAVVESAGGIERGGKASLV